MEWWQIKEDILKPLGGILVAPYLLVREIKQQVDLWKTRTTGELKALIDRLDQYKEEAPVLRERLCQALVGKLFADPS
jgi:nitrogen-specific signal transduction histidine kinase